MPEGCFCNNSSVSPCYWMTGKTQQLNQLFSIRIVFTEFDIKTSEKKIEVTIQEHKKKKKKKNIPSPTEVVFFSPVYFVCKCFWGIYADGMVWLELRTVLQSEIACSTGVRAQSGSSSFAEYLASINTPLGREQNGLLTEAQRLNKNCHFFGSALHALA